MLTKSEVLASLNGAVKDHLASIANAQMSSAVGDKQINTAVHIFIAGLQNVQLFHERALKAIETEFNGAQ